VAHSDLALSTEATPISVSPIPPRGAADEDEGAVSKIDTVDRADAGAGSSRSADSGPEGMSEGEGDVGRQRVIKNRQQTVRVVDFLVNDLDFASDFWCLKIDLF